MRALIHLSLLLTFGFYLGKFVLTKWQQTEPSSMGRQPYLFLTVWTIVWHIVYYSSTTVFSSKCSQRSRNLLFKLAYPLGCFVPIIFWTVYNIDREQIYSKANDELFGHALNHVMHTLPAITFLLGTIYEAAILCSEEELQAESSEPHLKAIAPSYIFTFTYYNSCILYFKLTGLWPEMEPG